VAEVAAICHISTMKYVRDISRRRLLTLGGAAAFSVAGGYARASAATRPVVVELFTSQGCSSCPPADAFMEDLMGMEGVIVLTYHVDYWDYLGWKDTLGSAENSQRQYDYAHARGDMDVYTPQIVINGRSHYVGSSRDVVLKAIASARNEISGPEVKVWESGKELVVDIAAGQHLDTTLWVLPIVPLVTVKVLKGEIAGQEIAYHNVVHELVPAGMWNGEARSFRLPMDGVLLSCCKGCVALLQEGKVGPIVGVGAWGRTSA
jgi:hypothetical protein